MTTAGGATAAAAVVVALAVVVTLALDAGIAAVAAKEENQHTSTEKAWKMTY